MRQVVSLCVETRFSPNSSDPEVCSEFQGIYEYGTKCTQTEEFLWFMTEARKNLKNKKDVEIIRYRGPSMTQMHMYVDGVRIRSIKFFNTQYVSKSRFSVE